MEDLDRRLLLGAAGLAGVAALARVGRAGPLSPPAGSMVSTGRTIEEVYNKIAAYDGRIPIPGGSLGFGIAQRGSYVLTGDITTSGGGNGILISGGLPNVTIDLNGYTITSSASTGTGIACAGAVTQLVVRNGFVQGFGTGLQLTGGTVVVEDVVVDSARQIGISVNVPGQLTAAVRRCTVSHTGVTSGTGEAGLVMGINIASVYAVVEDCLVQHCISNTVGQGVYGIYQNGASSAVIRRNVVINAVNGIRMNTTAGCVYRDNTVSGATTAYTNGFNGGGNVP